MEGVMTDIRCAHHLSTLGSSFHGVQRRFQSVSMSGRGPWQCRSQTNGVMHHALCTDEWQPEPSLYCPTP